MNGPNLIVSKNAVPATNLKELTAWLKANPGERLVGALTARAARCISAASNCSA